MSHSLSVDVAVAGGGPAASATAFPLACAGMSVAIVERGDDAGDKPGESIAPAARPLLEQLGVWEDLGRDGHLPCHGNRSSWGGDGVDELPFLFTPYGQGWHIDRRRFERALMQRACDAGVQRLTRTRVLDARRERDTWRLCCDGGTTIDARFVVDATGRAGAIARLNGARRIVDDTLVALVAFLNSDGEPDPDSFTLVEAVEDGWWYTAVVPDGRLATMFVTDRVARWQEMLARTRHTRERIEKHRYRLRERPRVVDAGSARLDRVAGEGWIAVGDAATALDPLSSHGITGALASGIEAAQAILSGSSARYEHIVSLTWTSYLASRRAIYAQERRWRDAPFWRGRR